MRGLWVEGVGLGGSWVVERGGGFGGWRRGGFGWKDAAWFLKGRGVGLMELDLVGLDLVGLGLMGRDREGEVGGSI